MKSKMLLFSFFTIVALNGFAQTDTAVLKKADVMSIDVAGESFTVLSVHWDKIVKRYSGSYVSINVGAGFTPKNAHDALKIGIPVSILWNGSSKNNHLEMGLGAVYCRGLNGNVATIFSNGNTVTTANAGISHTVLAFARLGYRYQSSTNPVFFRAGFVPAFILMDIKGTAVPSFWPTFGISIGYAI